MSDSFEFALKFSSGHESLYFDMHQVNSSAIPHEVVADLQSFNYSANTTLLEQQVLSLSATAKATAAAQALEMSELLAR